MSYCRSFMVVFTFCFMVLSPGAASAMRCGSQIVSKGDTKAEVLAKCGQPLLREYIGKDAEFKDGYDTYSERIVEEWTYNFGPRKFMQILRFRGSTLIQIINGDKGF
ncbi:MAG: DUF2845 domain-containing protein [Pedobacter sp.]